MTHINSSLGLDELKSIQEYRFCSGRYRNITVFRDWINNFFTHFCADYTAEYKTTSLTQTHLASFRYQYMLWWVPDINTAFTEWTWHLQLPYMDPVSQLTLNVRGPSYLGLTRSISWLLMPWLLTSPGHQQPWYWLCRIGGFLSYLRKDFKYLRRINVEKWHKMQIYVYFPFEKFST